MSGTCNEAIRTVRADVSCGDVFLHGRLLLVHPPSAVIGASLAEVQMGFSGSGDILELAAAEAGFIGEAFVLCSICGRVYGLHLFRYANSYQRLAHAVRSSQLHL